jgi:hypothetical protein
LGLPIIGKLLGHTQAQTTARYAHLADDPLRKASSTIGATIAEALDRRNAANTSNALARHKIGTSAFVVGIALSTFADNRTGASRRKLRYCNACRDCGQKN